MSLHMRVVAPSPVRALFHPISLFHRVWPVTALGAGLLPSVAWTAFIA